MESPGRWQLRAACRGTGIDFFLFERADIERAKAVCRTCPVVSECLDYAVNNRVEHGVWGGLDEDERRKVARARRRRPGDTLPVAPGDEAVVGRVN